MPTENKLMVNYYAIDIDDIGLVTLERSSRARHVIISVRPFKGVRVAVPDRVSFRKAEAFVFSKTEWVKEHLEKIKKYETERKTIRDNFDDISKATAKKTLTSRLKLLAEKHGFRYNKENINQQAQAAGREARVQIQ